MGLAVLLRVAYFLDYLELPFLGGPVGDSAVYLEQARAVRAGELGNAALLAFSPLYGYLLAFLGAPAITGIVVTLQIALGVATTWLLHRAVTQRFGELAGLVSALCFVTYGMPMFYETKVLSDALGLSLTFFGAALFTSERAREGGRFTVLACIAVALSVWARASVVFSVPIFCLVAFVPWRDEARSLAFRRGAVVVGTFAVLFLSYGAYTKSTSGAFVMVTYQSSDSTTAGRDFDGDLRSVALANTPPSAWDLVRAVEADRERGERDSSLLSTIAAIDITGVLRGAPSKLARAFSPLERTFQYGYYAERTMFRSLGLLPMSFTLLLLLGVIGLAFLAKRDGPRALLPYLPYLLGCVITCVLYLPSSRYRLAMIAPALLLAGFAVAQLIAHRRERFAQALVGFVLVVGSFGAFQNITYTLKNPAAWQLTIAESYAVQRDELRLVHHVNLAQRLAPQDRAIREHAFTLLRSAGIKVEVVPSR